MLRPNLITAAIAFSLVVSTLILAHVGSTVGSAATVSLIEAFQL